MTDTDDRNIFIFGSYVNSFHYLYQDADYLSQIAHRKEMVDVFERVRLCRTAILLYIFSLEGLINRAMDHFLPERVRDFFLERENKLSAEDKWMLLPMLASEIQSSQFDKSSYPWSHFAELVGLRNDFVHPKHNRRAYYRVITSHNWEPLPWNQIPKDLGVKQGDVVYRQTQIPKDPYAMHPEHVDKVKKVVDDMVAELDRLLDGKVSKDNWYKSDQMQLIYPPNASLNDLPPRPQK